MIIKIKNYERGLLFKDGNFVRVLIPGKYLFNPLADYQVIVMDVNKPFIVPGKNLNLFLHDEALTKELSIIDVKDHEIVLHFEEEKFSDVYQAGKYAFWNVLIKHDFIVVDTRNPEVGREISPAILRLPNLVNYIYVHVVESFEVGILYFNNLMQKTLEPGIYYFWKGPVSVSVKAIDLRQQQMEMTGQEIMTEDKISLRLNFVCQYKILNPLKVVEIKNFEEQIYILLQLILREYIGSLKLDELLKTKQEIGNFVLARLKEKSNEFGVEFTYAGVKDVILPGEIKDILNTVLLAEKRAQANIITRREEIASTRSLLNTAKLMEENQTLYRLKELEFLEKICDKIGNVSLMGGGTILEQLNSLLASKTSEN